MKILLVNDYGTLTGGAEVIVFGLRDSLRAHGHDVRVFASIAGSRSDHNLADHVCFGTVGRWRTLVQMANVPAARALRGVIDRFRPDVVHVNLYLTQLSPLILSALKDVPAVYYAQWYRAICPLGTRWLPEAETCVTKAGTACLRSGCVPHHDWASLMTQMALDRVRGGRFAKVAAISRTVADRLREFGAPHLHSATVVHPGTAIVEPRQTMARVPTVIAAGRLVREKGIDVLLRAFARVASRHQQSRLLIAGDGPEAASLGRLAQTLAVADRVDFLGHLNHVAVLAEVRTAWVACVPSVWEEPFGMIAAEAQMHGVPVVASHSGGLAEIVDDGVTGFLVPPGDAAALADRLDAVFSDKTAALAFGCRGHERARAVFSLDAFACRFEAIYEGVIDGHAGGA